MAEDLVIQKGTKEDKYISLFPQLKALCEGEPNLVANLANISAAIKQTFDYYWVGFYLIEEDELVLGPFQGPIACTRIQKGKGVCGTAWKKEETILVEDVNEFQGHIACNSMSKSEIVIPLFKEDKIIGVFDLDHNRTNAFDEVDKKYLNQICTWLASIL